MAKLLIVDESPLARFGLRLLLEQEGLQVVDEVDNGIAALESVSLHEPEYVILDLSTSMLGGLDLIRRLQSRRHSIRILVLTSLSPQHYAERCLKAGAVGFLSKQEPLARIRTAVTSVLQGRSYFPIDLLHGRPERKVSTHKLTNREMTVLQMLIQGKRVRDIAMQLMLSHKTISTHKYRIMQKMGVASFAELVHAARKMGVHVEFDA